MPSEDKNIPVSNQSANHRREERQSLDSLILPFMGSREPDQGDFEYILYDISTSGVGISMPKWLVSRESLKRGDIINLNLPFKRESRFYTRGVVMWTKWDEENEAQVCGIRMDSIAPMPYYPIFISLSSGGLMLDLKDFELPDNILQTLLKDAYLIKRGILIYFKHLIPFFSRITDHSREEFVNLDESFLSDIQNQIKRKADALLEIYDTSTAEKWNNMDFSSKVDIGNLRILMETAVQRDLLMTVFDRNSVRPYLDAIHELEKKQNNTYNTLVMLYIRSFDV